jgi:hypothetical protein
MVFTNRTLCGKYVAGEAIVSARHTRVAPRIALSPVRMNCPPESNPLFVDNWRSEVTKWSTRVVADARPTISFAIATALGLHLKRKGESDVEHRYGLTCEIGRTRTTFSASELVAERVA